MTHLHEALTCEPCNDGLAPHTKFETWFEALRRENCERAGKTEATIIHLSNTRATPGGSPA